MIGISTLHEYSGDLSGLPKLPVEWRWATIGDITHNFDGKRVPIKSSDRDVRSGTFPYYGASGIIDDIDDFLFDGEYLLIAEDGANLLSRSTPIAFRASGKFWVNNHAHVVQTADGMPLQYLEWYLNGTNLQFFITGSAQPKLNQLNLNRIPIPVAPLPEQRRIVSKIEELFSDLDAGVKSLERAKANLKRYRASVLKAAVEGRLTADWRAAHPDIEPASELLKRILTTRRQTWESNQLAEFERKGKKPPEGWQDRYKEPHSIDTGILPVLPAGWMWTTMDAISTIAGGITKGQKLSASTELREVPYLRVANVQRGFLDLNDVKTIATRESEIEQLALQTGDILFNEGGDRDKLGRGWVWEGQLEECIHQNHVFRARLLVPSVQARFVSHHGNTFGQQWFMRTGKQSVNLASINLTVLKQFPVPLPPSAEQAEIIRTLDELLPGVEHSRRIIDAGLLRSCRLRQSILKRAFEGKLFDTSDATSTNAECVTN